MTDLIHTKRSLAWAVCVRLKGPIAWVLLFSLLVNLLTLTPTLYMMHIYDRILTGQNLTSLLIISLLTLAFLLLMSLFEIVRARVLILLGNRIETGLSAALFQSSVQQFLLSRVQEPSAALRSLVEFKQFVAGPALVCFFDIVWSPVYVLFAYMLHPLLGVVTLGMIVGQLILLFVNHRLLSAATSRHMRIAQQQQSDLQTHLNGLLPMHAMGYAGYFRAQWLAAQSVQHALARQLRRRSQGMQFCIRYFRYLVQIVSLGLGAYLAIHGQITIGSMIAANVIMSRSLSPFDQLAQLWPQWVAFVRANQTLTALLQKTAVDTVAASSPQGALKTIQAAEYSAGYADHQPVLHQLHLQLSAAEVVAVVGKSGSGKTTFLKALAGLLPFTTGQLVVNQQAIVAGTPLLSATEIGYLPQDGQLFEGAVAENIARFGVADSQAVILAAKRAGIHEWVLRLPRGYDTLLGPDGLGLSGGQKQQLALARAIYGQPSLVILDEPNAHLDEQGERALHQLLLQMKRCGSLTLVTSHRESVLSAVDKILWLEAGTVKAFGPTADILASMKAEGVFK